jgi:endonuclease III
MKIVNNIKSVEWRLQRHSAKRWLQMFGKTICKKMKPEKGIGIVWEFGNRKLKI